MGFLSCSNHSYCVHVAAGRHLRFLAVVMKRVSRSAQDPAVPTKLLFTLSLAGLNVALLLHDKL